jgi:hypothetical protein
MFDEADVYGIGYDRAAGFEKTVKLAVIGCGGVAQSKHIPAIMRLKTIWEPIELVGVSAAQPAAGRKVEGRLPHPVVPPDYGRCSTRQAGRRAGAGAGRQALRFAAACFERGFHVLVEKPITRDLTRAAEMCKIGGRTRPDADDRLHKR